jgi:hypothetical protein
MRAFFLLIFFPSILFAQSFKVNISPKHQQKLSAIKSGHQRMMRYYKFYKKDSAKHSKAWSKSAKRYQDSLLRTQLGTEKLKVELAKRGIPADRQWQYAQQVQSEFTSIKTILKSATATDSAKREAKKKLKKLTGSKLNKQLAGAPLAGLKPSEMPEHAREELKHWWAVMKDTTSSDSLKKVAKEKVKSITMSHAMENPNFKGLYQYYQQYGQKPDWHKLSNQVTGLDTLKGAFDSSPDQLMASAENIAEQSIGKSQAIGGFSKHTAEVEKLKKQLGNFSNRDSLMKSGKAMAIDHFANQKEALQAAQNNATKLLGKYREYFNSGDSTVGVKRTSLKGKTWHERIVLGGNFNIVSTSPFSLDLSPLVGYRFNTKFYAGIGANYRQTFGDSLRYINYISPTNTSVRVFASYDLIKNFFAYAEAEAAGLKIKSKESITNGWRFNYFIGLGKKLLIHPKVFMTITAIYNLNGENNNPAYPQKFQVRLGFQTSDLAFRKKKIYYNP